MENEEKKDIFNTPIGEIGDTFTGQQSESQVAPPENIDYGDYENDSGEGEDSELPPQLRGLNWAAFFLGWIWGIAHNLLISLLTLIPYVGFIMNFVLLFKGNEWAWQNRRFKSVEHFKKVQRIWLVWGILYFLFLLFVVGSWLFVAYMMLMTRSKVG